jgi:S1-C subfamily serine protease
MALIPPSYFDCVVAIGIKQTDGTNHWIGTGFLFGNYSTTNPEGQKLYNIYLVTNKHVFIDQTSVIIRFNPQDDKPATDYPVSLKDVDGKIIWTGHPDDKIDIALLSVDGAVLNKDGMKYSFFTSDDSTFGIEKLKEIETTEGDFIYVLGFPMGLVGRDRQHVILRSGSIARIRDLFEKRSTDYVVDAFVFPGNSGGPVILKPEVISIQGTKSNNIAALIGVIKSYIPYQDVAISQQTNRPRIIFEDNSGLSIVEPIDYIIETINFIKTQSPKT